LARESLVSEREFSCPAQRLFKWRPKRLRRHCGRCKRIVCEILQRQSSFQVKIDVTQPKRTTRTCVGRNGILINRAVNHSKIIKHSRCRGPLPSAKKTRDCWEH